MVKDPRSLFPPLMNLRLFLCSTHNHIRSDYMPHLTVRLSVSKASVHINVRCHFSVFEIHEIQNGFFGSTQRTENHLSAILPFRDSVFFRTTSVRKNPNDVIFRCKICESFCCCCVVISRRIKTPAVEDCPWFLFVAFFFQTTSCLFRTFD